MNDELKSLPDSDDIFSEEKKPYIEDVFTKESSDSVNRSEEEPTFSEKDIFSGEFFSDIKKEIKKSSDDIFSSLESGQWEKAKSLCNELIKKEPENAFAYLGKLMCKYRICKKENLAQLDDSFEKDLNYRNLLLYGDEQLAEEIKGYLNNIHKRIYKEASDIMENASVEDDFFQAGCLFEEIPNYKDSAHLSRLCKAKSMYMHNSAIYNRAVDRLRFAETLVPNETTVQAYEASIAELKTIPDWEDVKEKLAVYQARLFDIKVLIEKNRGIRKEKAKKKAAKRNLRNFVIAIIVLAVLAGSFIGGYFLLHPEEHVHTFDMHISEEDVDGQYMKLVKIKDFKPVEDLLQSFVRVPTQTVVKDESSIFSTVRLNYTYDTSLNFIEGTVEAEIVMNFSFGLFGTSHSQTQYADAKTEAKYDESGRKVEESFIMNGFLASTKYEYDESDRCVKEIRTQSGNVRNLEHRYNNDGTLKKSVERDADNKEITHTYTYGNNGLIEKETISFPDSQTQVIEYTYNEFSDILSETTTYADGKKRVVEHPFYDVFYLGK